MRIRQKSVKLRPQIFAAVFWLKSRCFHYFPVAGHLKFIMSRKPNLYKKANEDFLAAKAQEEGMVVLDNGVMYRVLEKGSGSRCPKPSGIVYVRYTGRLIDGTVFDSTEGQPLPALFVVRDLIMGWQIALTRMHEGDRWEVYIPAKWGYGAVKMDDIPAHSTLVFDMELVKIER